MAFLYAASKSSMPMDFSNNLYSFSSTSSPSFTLSYSGDPSFSLPSSSLLKSTSARAFITLISVLYASITLSTFSLSTSSRPEYRPANSASPLRVSLLSYVAFLSTLPDLTVSSTVSISPYFISNLPRELNPFSSS